MTIAIVLPKPIVQLPGENLMVSKFLNVFVNTKVILFCRDKALVILDKIYEDACEGKEPYDYFQ